MEKQEQVVRVGTGVFVYRDGLLLLGKRKGSHAAGTYCLPGGAIEFGEEPIAAAQREVEEETGMVVQFIGMWNSRPWVNTIFDDGGGQWVTLFFQARCEGEPRLMEPEKNEGWGWYPHSEIPSPLMGPLEEVLG
ncbi:hypothetical protein LCGC14_1600860 [marine sediment metagenome]|uniref:Nudix hydrolase domain-containing protein n=1 Tax=marine sediment metagenome TaxID=412755 RepID=A0A0F9IB72_9ZZZZ